MVDWWVDGFVIFDAILKYMMKNIYALLRLALMMGFIIAFSADESWLLASSRRAD